jgi:acetylornithine deacetylase
MGVLTVHAQGASVQINTLGVSRHIAHLEESVSAIDSMHKVIQRLKQMKFSQLGNPNDAFLGYAGETRLNITSMTAGFSREYTEGVSGLVPDFATIRVSIRHGPGHERAAVLADIKRELDALQKEDPAVRAELVVPQGSGRPPLKPFYVSANEPIVRTVVEAHTKVLGTAPPVGALDHYRYYGTDAAILQHLGGMTGITCGPSGTHGMMADERVDLRNYHAASRIYALTALALCS